MTDSPDDDDGDEAASRGDLTSHVSAVNLKGGEEAGRGAEGEGGIKSVNRPIECKDR